jgi:hypothetical protein
MMTHSQFPPVGAELQIYHNGKVVQRSRNLRGLISRAGKVGVHSATLFCSNPTKPIGEGLMFIEYSDGSTVRITFASFTIARDFLRSRWRKWGLYAEVRNSDQFWSFI